MMPIFGKTAFSGWICVMIQKYKCCIVPNEHPHPNQQALLSSWCPYSSLGQCFWSTSLKDPFSTHFMPHTSTAPTSISMPRAGTKKKTVADRNETNSKSQHLDINWPKLCKEWKRGGIWTSNQSIKINIRTYKGINLCLGHICWDLMFHNWFFKSGFTIHEAFSILNNHTGENEVPATSVTGENWYGDSRLKELNWAQLRIILF